MIFFVELQMQGDKHVHVNSGLLAVLRLAFLNEQIKVTCDDIHWQNLLKTVGNNYISFTPFSYTGNKELAKRRMLGKLFREIFLAYKIFRLAKNEKPKFIIFASAFPFTAIFLKLLAKIFKQNIIVCLHGDIGVLMLDSKKITTKLFKYSINLFFKFKNKYCTLLFYGESIRDKLFAYFPHYHTDMAIAIDHPYNFNASLTKNSKQKVVIANIGTSIMNKNSHLFYDVAKANASFVINDMVEFLQIGNVSPEVISYSNEMVKIVNNNDFIPFGVFEENIKDASYFIYFFKENSLYDLCPSGTFFDAIRYCKPIIALKNPFFEYYFDKLGDIGFLCDSIQDMSLLVSKVIEGTYKKRYELQCHNLFLSKNKLSFELISKSFLHQYKRIN